MNFLQAAELRLVVGNKPSQKPSRFAQRVTALV
jgi:hypothetical protein